ncbi:MAG: EAL domain-containing protein, partial [Chloroflexi bacterium]|nr:EAL domain-containing protein [Chloroflexota bacterium]
STLLRARLAGAQRQPLTRIRRALLRSRKQGASVQQRLDSLVAHNPDAVYSVDRAGRFVSVNAASEMFTGYTADELVGTFLLDVIVPDNAARVQAHFLDALSGHAQDYEVSLVHKSGRRVELHVTNIPIVIDGECVGIYGVAKDITLRRRLLDLTRPMSTTSSVEGQVKLILGALREVLPYDSGGLYWVDHEAGLLRPNTLVASTWVSSTLESFEIPLDRGIMGAVARTNQGELVNNAHLDPRTIYPPDATVTCEHLVAVPVGVEGRTLGVFYVARRSDPPFSDHDFELVQLFIGHAAAAIEKTYLFEQTRASEERFHYQALHDPLTALPNRVLLHDRLEQAVLTAQRDSSAMTLLVLDLDRFKEVNDTLGHHAGDRLLQEVARRLRGALRAVDTVARLGGDEFAVVLPGADALAAEIGAAKVQLALDDPLVLDECELSVGASIGIATFPMHGADADTLLRHADIAMYAAKRARGGVATYSPSSDGHSSERLMLVAALRRAIPTDELSLHYQPQIDCATGHLMGVEALVRWWHPERGLIGPDQFVPLAEQSGLIRQLTRWVLAAALAQSTGWQDLGDDVGLSVNLSSNDLLDERLPAFVAQELQRRHFPAERLTLEITESALLADPDRAGEVLAQIRQLGVRVALDDFGTGYSSLSYLKEWPVDEVKVDRSFVRNLVTDQRDRAIVRATIDLSHSLGLDVVAEGVEDAATLRLLIAMGSDRAQGFYIARPLPPSRLLVWCHAHRGRPELLRAAAA